MFELNLSSGKAQVAITIADQSKSELAIEFYFKDLSFIGIEMWQRFHLSPDNKNLKLNNGYVLMPMLGKPFILSDDYLKGFDGAQLTAFMINSEEEMKSNFIGKESISVPAGTVEALHYRIKDRGQTIDFWIHESAKPVGIVKMTSKGTSIKQNYELSLLHLIENAGAKINPNEARPLTKEAKEFLPKVGTELLAN